jgi:hypothetical protein
MMNDNIHLKKYFNKRSLHGLGRPFKKINKTAYRYIIVIPCYNEFDYIFDTLTSINKQKSNLLEDTLVIIVINNSDSDNFNIKENNIKTHQSLIQKIYKYDFISIDCFSLKYQLTKDVAGVGYARKIGLDFALEYALNTKSVLCCLDADTLIDDKYLDKISYNYIINKINVGIINFKHQKSNDPILEEGIRKYESILKEIAHNIEKTGSPYGYVSMGSTITCNVKSYVACGGMNIKKATEDFYFLQSLAKYTKIEKIKDILVFPSSRNENRVYLGTGFRMDEYYKNKTFKNLDFNQDSYNQLSKIIKIVKNNSMKDGEAVFKELSYQLNEKSIAFLIEKKVESILNKFKNNAKDIKQYNLFFNQWFDALTIMKFLKYLNN